MIFMGDGVNLQIEDDKYIYFTYDLDEIGEFDTITENQVSNFLKRAFLDISDIYSINLFGYYQVDIYLDKKIGGYVEISKIEDFVTYSRKIDTKVSISTHPFYLKTKNLLDIYKYRPIYALNDEYYVSTSSVDNVFELLEFCEIEYHDVDIQNR